MKQKERRYHGRNINKQRQRFVDGRVSRMLRHYAVQARLEVVRTHHIRYLRYSEKHDVTTYNGRFLYSEVKRC